MDDENESLVEDNHIEMIKLQRSIVLESLHQQSYMHNPFIMPLVSTLIIMILLFFLYIFGMLQ
ncbi:hypothetical protein pb186bvf_012806 [Paramecium bursaria]